MSDASTAPDNDLRLEGGDLVIQVDDLTVGFGERNILNGLAMDVRRGEILGVVGASGTGKSVLLRTIIGLVGKKHGSVRVFGHDMDKVNPQRRRLIEKRWGVLFQHGALFSSLTVKQNIQFPMREYLDLSPRLLDEMAMLKLQLVGLKPEAAERFPSELSGGMIKRVALARALALDPEIVFLDEPTSGLDPDRSGRFRSIDRHIAINSWAYRVYGDARSRLSCRNLRSHSGLGGRARSSRRDTRQAAC
jgi:phospholipid/cholesterol/gamma-HCH transport system ATP-binding protein